MAAEDVSGSVTAAQEHLREQWSENGDTDAITCPSCDASEYEWEIKDTQVRMRCEHCGYFGSRRYVE